LTSISVFAWRRSDLAVKFGIEINKKTPQVFKNEAFLEIFYQLKAQTGST
jgi:hypothetical protein